MSDENKNRSPIPEPGAGDALLRVKDLHVSFPLEDGTVRKAVDGVTFDVPRGKVTCIVGESGSGKSVTAMSAINLIDRPGRIDSGSIDFDGRDVLAMDAKSLQRLRGEGISMIFQEPMHSLNPVFTIGSQMVETIMTHLDVTKKEAWAKSVAWLERVGLPNPERIMRLYPYELSGGMVQRAMIAIALSCEPKLLIADEPTTALDVTIQARILQLIRELQGDLGISVVFITHNFGVVAKVADYVNVMYAGKIVESGTTQDVFFDPRHPYTWGLLSSMPSVGHDRSERLFSIKGNPPNMLNDIVGDAFAPRNPYALDIDFVKEPPAFWVNDHHWAATWLLDPRAPKVEMPEQLKRRIERMRQEGAMAHGR